MPPAVPLWGVRQGRFCPARGSAGAGDRQTPSTCRPAVLLASGIGSNADVLPVVPLPRLAGSVVGRVALPVKSGPHTLPVAVVPPAVSPAPSPGNGCWPGPVILAVKIGFRPPAHVPPVKIGCRYAASPVVLPLRQRQAKMILLLADKIKGGSAVNHSTRARRQCANGGPQKIQRANLRGSFPWRFAVR